MKPRDDEQEWLMCRLVTLKVNDRRLSLHANKSLAGDDALGLDRTGTLLLGAQRTTYPIRQLL